MPDNVTPREYSDEDLDRAITWAVEAFAGKRDRQGKPAILHALRVMLAGKDNAERIVGVLHDVLEDTNTRADDLRYDFDAEIVDAIELLTRQKTSTTTYAQYIARLAVDPLARAVKLNDLADNIARAHELPEAEARSLTARYRNAQFTLGADLDTVTASGPTAEPSHPTTDGVK